MVMDVTPSPQCVGREFVRQYYTLLNKAPTHVHRFYNNNSSFVHGGLEVFNREGKPAVGQKQIHQCIQQLNFRDCHAKITQVDSQATLGNGVVVQVTGELSNGGQPMRRFTQTFVLGAQSPKQYYVHNDIFRYQDLVFGDDDPEGDSHHYEPEDEELEHPMPAEIQQVQVSQLEQAQYYSSAPPLPTVNGAPHVDEPPVPPQAALVQVPPPTTPVYEVISQQLVHQEGLQNGYQSEDPQAFPDGVMEMKPDGNLTHSLDKTSSTLTVHVLCQQQQQGGLQSGYQSEECELEPEEELPDEVVDDKPGEEFNLSLEKDHPITECVSPNEPKTYASTLVKSGGGLTNFNTSPNAPSRSPPSPPLIMMRLDSRNNEANLSGGRGLGMGGGAMRPPRGTNMRGMGRPSIDRPPMPRPSIDDSREFGGRDDFNMDGERRRVPNIQSQYSDEHQLFLGNLPLNASESDLRDLFRKFGTIVDLRIMSKSSLKSQIGNKVPNYGFIIFESVQTVQEVLNAKPIYFPAEGGVKLNVEEKKTRPRMDSGGRGGVRPAPMGMRGSMTRGGQRGGFARGMRPGPGFSQRGSAPR